MRNNNRKIKNSNSKVTFATIAINIPVKMPIVHYRQIQVTREGSPYDNNNNNNYFI